MITTVLSPQALNSEREVLWHLVDFDNSYHFRILCVGVPLLLERREAQNTSHPPRGTDKLHPTSAPKEIVTC